MTLIDTALDDFRTDPQYLEAALKSVRQTRRKRQSWFIRTAARRVVEAAQQRCVTAGVQVCTVAGPCGVGACPFAEGSMVAIRVSPRLGMATRPEGVVCNYPTFDEDALVAILRQLVSNS